VVDRLRALGATVVVPRSKDYDLIDRAACRRVLADSKPEIVFPWRMMAAMKLLRLLPNRLFYAYARRITPEPPKPGAPAQFGATTARDLVSALSDLLSAQNDFLGVWVSYEVLRMLVDFELGTMQLTNDGRWSDPGPLTGEAIRKRLAAWTIVEKGNPKAEAVSRLNR
ncbi:MAG: hypothetical protein ABMA01_24010, partial [Chthoniobacteraceae bacterium]